MQNTFTYHTHAVADEIGNPTRSHTYGGNTGDTGTDLYTEASHPSSGDYKLHTSAEKPGFDSNNYAYVSYSDGDETPKAEYLDPVLQVHPLMVEGEAALQVLSGHFFVKAQ